jgi:hypothetical protein
MPRIRESTGALRNSPKNKSKEISEQTSAHLTIGGNENPPPQKKEAAT